MKQAGIMSAPAIHNDKNSPRLHIYLERYTTGSTFNTADSLILLAGGPGQKASVWHDDLETFTKSVGTVYLMEQRGVGSSSRLCGTFDDSWKVSFEPSMDPKWFSISSAANDVVMLGRKLQRRGQNVSILGVSYGGLLAARAVTIAPQVFEWLIMDSPSMIKDRFSVENDQHFWQNCLDDNTCRRKIGSVKAIRRAYHLIVSGRKTNECTKIVADIPNFLSPFLKGSVVDSGKSDRHPAMLTVPFILNILHCKDPEYFRKHIYRPMRNNRKSEFIGEGRHPFSVHNLHNSYICAAEIFEYPEPPRECQAGGKGGLADQCANWEHYLRAFHILQSHLYPLDRHRFNPIKTEHTRVVVLSGGMDLVTPPRPTIEWLKTVEAPLKVALLYKTMGHGLTPNAPCLKYLFELIGSKDDERPLLRKLVRCIQKRKCTRLDWSMPGEYSFARHWWSKLP